MNNSSNPPTRGCITFLTDFGTRDTYVGQMKGVALGINPGCQLVDLSHEIPAQDIVKGAYMWKDAVSAFPTDTIHVAVVDPGVGSSRRLIAAEIGGRRFVCPDNGLLTVILKDTTVDRVVCLDDRRWWRPMTSNTFHGRDILTPVAAAWSLGHAIEEFGSRVTTALVTLPLAALVRSRSSLNGQIVDIDRFGNLMTNIPFAEIPENASSLSVDAGGIRIVGISKCYSDVAPGEILALADSAGRIEISIRNGSAADELMLDLGSQINVRWSGTNS